MGDFKQTTKKVICATTSASVEQQVFSVRGGITQSSFQVSIANVAVSTACSISPCDVTVACDSITIASHGYVTGLVGQLTTSCADLPSGLSTGTNYYVIKVDNCSIKLATSRANAIAGTPQPIADAGTGTHTFTPASIDACTPANNGTITFHASNDGVNYSSTNLCCVSLGLASAGSNTLTVFPQTPFNEIQVDADILIGQWTIDVIAVGK